MDERPTGPRPSPGLVAAADQAVEEARVVARIVAAYWKQLRAEGMDDYEAMHLAGDVGMRLLFPPDEDKEEEEP